MCGQFYVDEKDAKTLQKQSLLPSIPKGLIRPTDPAFTWITSNQKIQGKIMRFGWQKQSLLINARSETILEKPSFRNTIYKNRCIVPCTCYYEWTKLKEKASFYLADQMLYMAGIYENDQFVILTTKANPSVNSIHNRMPLILDKKLCRAWLQDSSALISILQSIPPLLQSKQRQKQLSFF